MIVSVFISKYRVNYKAKNSLITFSYSIILIGDKNERRYTYRS